MDNMGLRLFRHSTLKGDLVPPRQPLCKRPRERLLPCLSKKSWTNTASLSPVSVGRSHGRIRRHRTALVKTSVQRALRLHLIDRLQVALLAWVRQGEARALSHLLRVALPASALEAAALALKQVAVRRCGLPLRLVSRTQQASRVWHDRQHLWAFLLMPAAQSPTTRWLITFEDLVAWALVSRASSGQVLRSTRLSSTNNSNRMLAMQTTSRSHP